MRDVVATTGNFGHGIVNPMVREREEERKQRFLVSRVFFANRTRFPSLNGELPEGIVKRIIRICGLDDDGYDYGDDDMMIMVIMVMVMMMVVW